MTMILLSIFKSTGITLPSESTNCFTIVVKQNAHHLALKLEALLKIFEKPYSGDHRYSTLSRNKKQ